MSCKLLPDCNRILAMNCNPIIYCNPVKYCHELQSDVLLQSGILLQSCNGNIETAMKIMTAMNCNHEIETAMDDGG
jgi:hypothetical protein